MGGNKLLEARRGHAPFLAVVSVGCNSLGKCSMDYSLPGDALPHWLWLGMADSACGGGWEGESPWCDLYSLASFPAPLGQWEA